MKVVLADYLAVHKGAINPKTWDTMESNLRLHVPDRVKRLPIDAMTVGLLESVYVSALKKPLARSTVKRVRSDLSVVFSWAVRRGIIDQNVVTGSHVPAGDTQTEDVIFPFSTAQLEATLLAQSSLNSQYAAMTEFAALTGLRWGELVALRVADFVLQPLPSIIVSRSGSDGYMIKRTKSNNTRRIPLVRRAEEILQVRLPGTMRDDLIFTSPSGKRLNGGNFKRAIKWEVTAPGHRFHDLRHTAATRWLQSGIEPRTVAQWLGHSTPTMTLNVYAHYLGVASDLTALELLER